MKILRFYVLFQFTWIVRIQLNFQLSIIVRRTVAISTVVLRRATGVQPRATTCINSAVGASDRIFDLLDEVPEVLDQLRRNLIGEIIARVEHGAQQAFDIERGIQKLAYSLKGIEERR
jgi:hypothetical protein